MRDIAKIKAHLSKIRPFVTYTFRGIDNCLVFEELPLTVAVHPPSPTFILESGQLTTLLLRYSDTYKKSAKTIAEKNPEVKGEFAEKVMKEMAAKVMKTPEEQAKQVGVMLKIGKEFLLAKSIFAWYDKEEDKFPIRFFESPEESNVFNEKSDDDSVGFSLDMLQDMELINISLKLIQAIPVEGEDIPNIPIESVDDKGESVTESVPADKVTDFRRNIRDIAVEDVPPPSSGNIGDTESVS